MGISEDIQQKTFKSPFAKAIINILYTSAWIGQKHMSVFRPKGLTTPQYNVLRILRGQHPEPATVNLIIDRMIDKSSNASRIVDKLESKGLVERKQCKSDRRAVDVVITPAGLKLLEDLDQEMESMDQLMNGLTEEEAAQLNDLLDKLRANSDYNS